MVTETISDLLNFGQQRSKLSAAMLRKFLVSLSAYCIDAVIVRIVR